MSVGDARAGEVMRSGAGNPSGGPGAVWLSPSERHRTSGSACGAKSISISVNALNMTGSEKYVCVKGNVLSFVTEAFVIAVHFYA